MTNGGKSIGTNVLDVTVEAPARRPRERVGPYRVREVLGEGGMGVVWRARDLTLERPVAVKLLFARDERDRNRLVDQFLREARIAALVKSYKPKKHFVVSAISGEGCREVCYAVMDHLEQNRKHAKADS